MSRFSLLLAAALMVACVLAGTPPVNQNNENVDGPEADPTAADEDPRPIVTELTTDIFLQWTKGRNRSIVLFYATGLKNQLKAKNNFQRAAAIAGLRHVDMEWAMVDCLQVEPWICGKLGFAGFPPARIVSANESSWNISTWKQDEHASANLVALAHALSGESFYQAYQEVIWGGDANKIIHALGTKLVEVHAQSTTGTLVSMISPKCGRSAVFFGSTLIPISNNQNLPGINVVAVDCSDGIAAKYCSKHGTVNYPHVKFFGSEEDVLDPMHGMVARPDDMKDLAGFISKSVSFDYSEL